MEFDNIFQKQKALLLGKQLFDIELTSRCNKVCPMCPRNALTRKQTDMPQKIFSTLVKWLPESCYVMFAGFGEPLLNKNIYSYIRELKEKSNNILISVYTNGKLLTAENVNKFLDAGLDLVQFSVINLEELKSLNSVIDLFSDIDALDKLRINVLYSDERELEEIKLIIKDSYLDIEKKFYLKKIHNRAGELKEFSYCGELQTCGTFFMDTFIDSKGNIQICSNDINGKNCLGNISKMSFTELLNLKETYFGNKEISMLCRNCSDEYRIKHFSEV